jgi:hypothetical protein
MGMISWQNYVTIRTSYSDTGKARFDEVVSVADGVMLQAELSAIASVPRKCDFKCDTSTSSGLTVVRCAYYGRSVPVCLCLKTAVLCSRFLGSSSLQTQ